MRILFIIVGLSALLLAGLVVSEIRTTNELSSQIRDVQSTLYNLNIITATHRRSGDLSLGIDCLSPLLDELHTFQKGRLIEAVCSVALLIIGTVGIFVGKKSPIQTVKSSASSMDKTNMATLIVVAFVLAVASWPLLFDALVREYVGLYHLYDAPAPLLVILWIASGVFWGVVVELLCRMIRQRRPNKKIDGDH